MSKTEPATVYKILSSVVWEGKTNPDVVPQMPIDEMDGYIHLSTAQQLSETLRLHFKGQTGLVLLGIDTATVADLLKWEPSRGGDLFPHVYGDLPITAVTFNARFDVAADGSSTLPPEVK